MRGGLSRCRLQGLSRSVCPLIQGSGVGLFTHSPLLAGLAFLPGMGRALVSSSEQMEPCWLLARGLVLLGQEKGPPPPSMAVFLGARMRGLGAVWLGSRVSMTQVPHAHAEDQASVQSPSRQQSPRADPWPPVSLPRPYGTSCRGWGFSPSPRPGGTGVKAWRSPERLGRAAQLAESSSTRVRGPPPPWTLCCGQAVPCLPVQHPAVPIGISQAGSPV